MICPNCGKEFTLNKKQGGQNRIFCYECLPECSDRATRNQLRRKLIVEYSRKRKLESGCAICGYNKCASALEWHHPNNDKAGDPSSLMNKSFTQFLQEIDKCIVLCANCHREIHEKENLD